jgi:hypothetical protein
MRPRSLPNETLIFNADEGSLASRVIQLYFILQSTL